MTLLILFSRWIGGIYLLLPLERRMWFITKEWWISQESTRLCSAVIERSALGRQCFLPWKCFRTVLQQVEIQTPLKLIPKLLLTSPEPRFPQKNPYEYLKSLEVYFNSNAFPMELETERKKREVKACGRKRNQSFLPPSFSWKDAADYPQKSTSVFSPLPFAPTGLIPSRPRSHGQPEPGNAPLLALLALWDQPTA